MSDKLQFVDVSRKQPVARFATNRKVVGDLYARAAVDATTRSGFSLAADLRRRIIRITSAARPTTIPIICEVERPVSVVKPKISPRGSSRKNSITKRTAA